MGKTAAQESRVHGSVEVVQIPISGASGERIPTEVQTNKQTRINTLTHDVTEVSS